MKFNLPISIHSLIVSEHSISLRIMFNKISKEYDVNTGGSSHTVSIDGAVVEIQELQDNDKSWIKFLVVAKTDNLTVLAFDLNFTNNKFRVTNDVETDMHWSSDQVSIDLNRGGKVQLECWISTLES